MALARKEDGEEDETEANMSVWALPAGRRMTRE